MLRSLRSTFLVPLLALAAGCVGDWELPPDGGADLYGRDLARSPLRDLFDAQVRPVTDAACASCHNKDGGAGPAFLRPDAYDSLRAWPGMIARDPATSRLITKGAHAGPAFTQPQLAAIMPWLTAEAKALPPDTIATAPSTTPKKIVVGPNSLDLGAVGIAGASVTFDAAFAGSSLVLSNVTLRAGSISGVRAVHPLFLVWSSGTKYPDPTDSLAGVDVTVMRGGATTLGPGTVILLGVGALDEIAIAFEKISVSGTVIADGGAPDAMDGGTTGGCKAVAAFTTNTRPPLQQRCVSCHGGSNALATNALDMTRLADTSTAAQAAACDQVKTRVSTTTPASSAIFTSVAPTSTGHPYKFADTTSFTAYQQMVTQWINQEK